MKFSIFTIVKNEHEYLDEWISYHKKIGIDKIYIFDDVTSKSHIDICNKYENVYNTNILNILNPIKRIVIKEEIKKKKELFFSSCVYERNSLFFKKTSSI